MNHDLINNVISSGQAAVLCGIFMRLGGMTRALEDFKRRLERVEQHREMT